MRDVVVLCSQKVAAALLGTTAPALAARARRGEIPTVAVNGEVMYDLDAIERAKPRTATIEDGTVWLPIPEYVNYEVSHLMQVRRTDTKRLLKPNASGAVFLRHQGHGVMRSVRVLLATAVTAAAMNKAKEQGYGALNEAEAQIVAAAHRAEDGEAA